MTILLEKRWANIIITLYDRPLREIKLQLRAQALCLQIYEELQLTDVCDDESG